VTCRTPTPSRAGGKLCGHGYRRALGTRRRVQCRDGGASSVHGRGGYHRGRRVEPRGCASALWPVLPSRGPWSSANTRVARRGGGGTSGGEAHLQLHNASGNALTKEQRTATLSTLAAAQAKFMGADYSQVRRNLGSMGGWMASLHRRSF
jgi:hypothetical protein